MITSYSELQTAVENWLDRTDLDDRIPEFISLAEAELRRDSRIRLVQTRTVSVSADDHVLPSDFRYLIEIYHDSGGNYGPLEIVPPGDAAIRKALHGVSGVPHYAAVIDDTDPPTLRLSPVPDGTYSMKLVYDSLLEPLSDTDTTNWLLDDHPDIYLYATLVEAEPFLYEDQRVPGWKARLEEKIDRFHRDQEKREYGGRLVARPNRALGG